MQHHETAKGGENSFFERWPDLKDQKFNKTIREVSTGYRRAFPQASVEEAIEDIGAMVMRKHSLAASPVPREKLTSPLPKPFVPAGAGAASGPAPTKPLASDEARMWAELVKD
jgi:hypothetical protein